MRAPAGQRRSQRAGTRAVPTCRIGPTPCQFPVPLPSLQASTARPAPAWPDTARRPADPSRHWHMDPRAGI